MGVSRSRDGSISRGSRTNLKGISTQRGAPRTTTAPRPGARSSKASVWLREAQARLRRLTLCLSHALSPAGGSAPRPGLEACQHVRPGRCAGWGTPAADLTGPGPKPPRLCPPHELPICQGLSSSVPVSSRGCWDGPVPGAPARGPRSAGHRRHLDSLRKPDVRVSPVCPLAPSRSRLGG